MTMKPNRAGAGVLPSSATSLSDLVPFGSQNCKVQWEVSKVAQYVPSREKTGDLGAPMIQAASLSGSTRADSA